MEKIPTIEGFAQSQQPAFDEHSKMLTAQGYIFFMSLAIDFAKLHVEAALKAASETHATHNGWDWVADEAAVMASYSLDNIK